MGRYFWLLFFELALIVIAARFIFSSTHSAKPPSQLSYSQESANKPASFLEPAVLGEEITGTPILIPTAAVPTLVSTPTQVPKKGSYRIMLYGDSMEETMGSSAQVLNRALSELYPQTVFTITNYARGSENVEEAYHRSSNLLPNLIVPDIVIVGSYAYNPFIPHSVTKHTEYLTRLLNRFREMGTKVYLLVEIAPTKNLFGSRVDGLNWDDTWRYAQSTNVIALLENALSVAQRMGVEVIDVYHDSIITPDKSGDIRYISSDDYIHPSPLGQEFTAAKIAREIDLN